MLWCSIGFRVGLGICFAMVIVGAVLYQGKVLIGIDVQSVCACLCLSVCMCVCACAGDQCTEDTMV